MAICFRYFYWSILATFLKVYTFAENKSCPLPPPTNITILQGILIPDSPVVKFKQCFT